MFKFALLNSLKAGSIYTYDLKQFLENKKLIQSCPMAQWVPRWIVVHLIQVRFLVNPWFQSGKSADCITYIKCKKTINHWVQRQCGSSNLGLLQLTRNWIRSINNP